MSLLRTRRIAVVGAGLAGLAAARRLDGAGADVCVFDKARGPGGRASTRRAEPLAFDHGAQYFTCRDPAFAPFVEDWCARGVVAPWEARVVRLAAGAIVEEPERSPRYVGMPRMSALGRDLAAGLRTEWRHRIETIERTADGWRLVSDAGLRSYRFDAVIVATPAPQAVPLLATHAALRTAVARVEMEPCHAAMVAFDEPLAVDFDAAFLEDSPLAWVACNAAKPGRAKHECWVLHATHAWSRERRATAPAEVLPALLSAFGDALGQALPRASHATAHRWLYASTSRPLGRPFLWDPEAGLGACGDWAFGGRIEDAFLSGHRIAGAMVAGAR